MATPRRKKPAAPSDDGVAVYVAEVCQAPPLSIERELLPAKRIRVAEQAVAELIDANLRLVVSIARRYAKPGFDVLDLIQEGNHGLLQAGRTFRPTSGQRFAPYARKLIREAIESRMGITPVILKV